MFVTMSTRAGTTNITHIRRIYTTEEYIHNIHKREKVAQSLVKRFAAPTHGI